MYNLICHSPAEYLENPRSYHSLHFYYVPCKDYLLWKKFCIEITVHRVETIEMIGVRLDKHLARDFGNAIAKCPFLQTLKFEANSMHNYALYHIANGVSHNDSLQNLYISYNRFNDIGFHYLIKGLYKNKTLKYLHLWNNNFVTADGLIEFASFLKRNTNLLAVCLTSYQLHLYVREALLNALHYNFMLEEFMMWFEDRSKVRSILRINQSSFQRIASEFINFLMINHDFDCFPTILGTDSCLEITSFFTSKEKEILLNMNDTMIKLKTLIATEKTDSFEKEMMDKFISCTKPKLRRKKEKSILDKICSIYEKKAYME